jgi:hypothetical protein
MARLCDAILEVATSHNGRDERYGAAIDRLRHAKIGGHAVCGVVVDRVPNPAHVPDFGHDYRCKCKKPEPWGVTRHYGISVVLEGAPSLPDVLGSYWLIPGVARIEICGMTIPETDLEELAGVETAEA